jgi:hypothetical protein
MKVKGRNGIYLVVPILYDETVPLTATLVFGVPGAGECAETVFVAEDCRMTGVDTRLSCKR